MLESYEEVKRMEITNDDQWRRAMDELEPLMDLDPEFGTDEARRLQELSGAIYQYEFIKFDGGQANVAQD